MGDFGEVVAHRSWIAMMNPSPIETIEPAVEESSEVKHDQPWIVIVWNDPINLMSYVSFVLQKLFGYSKEKADKLMLEVHHQGRAVVSAGPSGMAIHRQTAQVF